MCCLPPPLSVIVCTLASVSSMVTGVVVGVVGLAEALPQSAGAVATRLISWACVLLGVTGTAHACVGEVLCCCVVHAVRCYAALCCAVLR